MFRRSLLAAVLVAGVACGSSHHSATWLVRVSGDPSMAADVLHDRLVGLGLEARIVSVKGDIVTYALPRAVTRGEQEWLLQRGELTFRVVTANKAAGECATPAGRKRIARLATGAGPVTSCDRRDAAMYTLGPAERGIVVETAHATLDPTNNEWIVLVDFTDAAAFADLTARTVGHQLAIVLDGMTLSAPTIQEEIPGGSAQITGQFDEATARGTAVVLGHGVLPGTATVVGRL